LDFASRFYGFRRVTKPHFSQLTANSVPAVNRIKLRIKSPRPGNCSAKESLPAVLYGAQKQPSDSAPDNPKATPTLVANDQREFLHRKPRTTT
jgi:hypothetical protein